MTETVVRIASYNIRKARGLDNKRDPARVVQVINALGADIVALQEADRRLGQRKPAIPRHMIEAETDFALLELGGTAVSLGWHGNAVLVRKSVRVTGVAQLDFPGLEPRGAVQISLALGAGLCVVATHLGLLRRDRRAQLRLLDRATMHSGPTVIAGDFNEWSHRRGLEPLAGRFRTYAPGRSFHARRPVAALDRFALSAELTMRRGGVEQGALARRASDHLPVWSDVALPAHAAIC